MKRWLVRVHQVSILGDYRRDLGMFIPTRQLREVRYFRWKWTAWLFAFTTNTCPRIGIVFSLADDPVRIPFIDITTLGVRRENAKAGADPWDLWTS